MFFNSETLWKCHLLIVYQGASLWLSDGIKSTVLCSFSTVFSIIPAICLEQLKELNNDNYFFAIEPFLKIYGRVDSYYLYLLFTENIRILILSDYTIGFICAYFI